MNKFPLDHPENPLDYSSVSSQNICPGDDVKVQRQGFDMITRHILLEQQSDHLYVVQLRDERTCVVVLNPKS